MWAWGARSFRISRPSALVRWTIAPMSLGMPEVTATPLTVILAVPLAGVGAFGLLWLAVIMVYPASWLGMSIWAILALVLLPFHTSLAAHGYGLAWYELDVTWLQIRFLQLLGIARSVKVAKVTERIVEQEAA